MTSGQKLACLMVLILLAMFGSFVGGWQTQEWRFGKQLSDRDVLHQADLTAISNAATKQASEAQDKRLRLEQRLTASDQQYTRELSDAQYDQARLRDRLATADVRLSVLLDATDTAGGCNVPATPGPIGVVHAAHRAQLDPTHARRIIGITESGDQGLIALRACQAYAKEVSTPK